jgi:acyl carrier protein
MAGSSRGPLRAWLIAALTRRAPDFQGAIDDETALADGGLCLDSLTLTDLIADIEQTLGVEVREEEISPEYFGTVGRLMRFLERRGDGRIIRVTLMSQS